jgi:hypothetical protein
VNPELCVAPASTLQIPFTKGFAENWFDDAKMAYR